MSLIGNGIEYLEIDDYNDSEGGGADHTISRLGGEEAPGNTMEAEKRIRREIANSNERRRMQSINAGFQSLRTLLPRHEGEKLSKAAILQQTAEYIYALEQEKTRLLSQNCQLKRLLNQHEGGDIPIKKRKPDNIITECTTLPDKTEEMIGEGPEPVAIISVVENDELSRLRVQLDSERTLRTLLEDQVRTFERNFESQIYSDSLQDLPHQITLQYETADGMDGGAGGVSVTVLAESRVGDDVPELKAAVDVPAPAEHHTVRSEPCSRALSPVNMVLEQRSPSPLPLPALLEAAIKAEPGAEPEALTLQAGPASPGEHSRLYHPASTSRQNLKTIVEAIRHLEGDHLFAEEQQDLPLALTTKAPLVLEPPPRLLQVDMSDYLQFRGAPQARPGVIVVKHS